MERNGKVFEAVKTSLGRLKDEFLKTLLFWNEEVVGSSWFDIVGFVDCLFSGL